MVLQQHTACPVWGRAPAGSKVRVVFRGREVKTAAGTDGAWHVEVESGEAGGPFTLAVQSIESRNFEDVMVGEVWLVSGQSNAAQLGTFEAPTDDPRGVRFHLAVGNGSKGWSTFGSCPIIAWLLGHELRRRLNVPIGILCCAVGGTCIEQWKPGPDPDAKTAGPGGAIGPAGGLYTERLSLLQPYRLRGVTWWQGESNVNNAARYLDKFQALIRIWRDGWGQADLPFIWVQLERVVRQGEDWWIRIADGRAAIAQAQFLALATERTSMVVCHDITSGDLHPPQAEKCLIATRLALAAEALAYGKAIECSGPLPMYAQFVDGRIRIRFSHATGLCIKANFANAADDLYGFELRSGEGAFAKTRAIVEGESVFISVGDLPPPYAVRYAWGPMPTANLYNAAFLPAPTFELPVEP